MPQIMDLPPGIAEFRGNRTGLVQIPGVQTRVIQVPPGARTVVVILDLNFGQLKGATNYPSFADDVAISLTP